MRTPMNRRNLMFGAAAAALLTLGVLAGRTVFAPAPTVDPRPVAAATGATPATANVLAMDATRIAAAAIALERVQSGDLNQEIVAQATVAAAPGGEAILAARAAGAITQIRKRLGDPVGAGEVLAMIESPDASTIAADRATAAAKATAARATYARERRLFEAKVTARQDLEAAQAELGTAEAELRRTTSAAAAAHVTSDGRHVAVTSPVAGRVTLAPATLGAYVTAETELFRVADPRRIQIQASLPAADAGRVSPGDPARLEDGSGGRMSAVVRSVTPGLNSESHSATAVLAVTDGGGTLQPGQFVRAVISPVRGRSASKALVVPEEAIQNVGGRDAVFVRTTKGFVLSRVRVGARGEGRVEVLEGLRAGQTIATKNAFLLKAELGKSAEEEQ